MMYDMDSEEVMVTKEFSLCWYQMLGTDIYRVRICIHTCFVD